MEKAEDCAAAAAAAAAGAGACPFTRCCCRLGCDTPRTRAKQHTEKLTHRSTSHMWQFSAERGVFIRQLADFYFKRAFGAEASKALIFFNKLRSR